MLLELLPELVEKIFSYCKVAEVQNLSCCNCAYKEACREFLWQNVRIPFKLLLSKNELGKDKRITYLEYTESLSLIGFDAGLDVEETMKTVLANCSVVIKYCSNLIVLKTWFLSDDIFNMLSKYHTLQEMHLIKYAVNDSNLGQVCNIITGLKSLIIESRYGYGLSDEGLSNIRRLNVLERLTIVNCGSVTKKSGFSHISAVVTLRELTLITCRGLTNEAVECFHSFANLQKLVLSGCTQISDEALSHVATLVSLKELNLSKCSTWITNAGVEYLKNLVNLEKLCLRECNELSDMALWHISTIVSLRYLDLSYCSEITNTGAGYLCSLVNLELLYVSRCLQINDKGLSDIATLVTLKELNVSGCFEITNVGAKCLGHLVKLEKLDISGCYQITDYASFSQIRTIMT